MEGVTAEMLANNPFVQERSRYGCCYMEKFILKKMKDRERDDVVEADSKKGKR